jgi:phosphoribosylglycinamide formyltransferase-1
MKNIAVFASGSGTNAENIFKYFEHSKLARPVILVTDNPQAGALERAKKFGIETAVFPRTEFRSGERVLALMRDRSIDYIVLAGFLSLVPANIVKAFEGRIVNIHPALLPKYGGKGMYGHHVHEAVIANGEKESGITIHLVNERYDDGAALAQFKVEVSPDDTPDSLAAKIHKLEYAHFPEIIEREIAKL